MTTGQADDRTLADLRLRDFAPEPMVRLPEHRPTRSPAPAVDVHNHLGRWHVGDWEVPDVAALVGLMDSCNVATIVNLDGGWEDELEANLDRYDRAHDGRFLTFCRLDWSQADEPGWGPRLGRSLRNSAARGAGGVKMCRAGSRDSGTRQDYATYLRFLATDDEHFPYSDETPPESGRWTISGIDLPAGVLELVLGGNARRLLPLLGNQQ